MKVQDIMTKKVIFVSADALVVDISKILIESRIHGIPVVENKKIVGIITETDFFTKGAVGLHLPTYIEFLKIKESRIFISDEDREKTSYLLNAKAADIMSFPCITVEDTADVDEFFGLLKGRKLNSVPVVDKNNELVGIVTLADVIKLIKIS